MNTQLLAFSLLATTGLMAWNTTAQERSECEQAEECTCSCSCNNCCMPQPKKCIDCTAYTPAFYDLQCDCGFFVDGEFLYWYGREVNLPYAIQVATIPNLPDGTPTTSIYRSAAKKYFHDTVDWTAGFRVGLGFNSDCDGWDYYLNWTYYPNDSSSSTPVIDFTPPAPTAGQQAFLNLWINQSFVGAFDQTTPFFQQVSVKWNLTLNQVDLELGRRYWLSPCFTMRPYIALRGAWTRTSFRVTGTVAPAENVDMNFTSRASVNRIRNHTWGAGFLTGFQPTWYFWRTSCGDFSLYGNIDLALLWGEFCGRPMETYLEEEGVTSTDLGLIVDINNTATESYYKMHAIFDLAIGLSWEQLWCCDSFRSVLSAGWEHHIWFQHGQYHRSFGNSHTGGSGPGAIDYFVNSIDTEHNLAYGGLVIRLRFDF